MARFTTHTEGGSWTGGGTEVPNCSAGQQRLINAALAVVQTIVNSWSLGCLTSVRDRLQDRLNCSLEIDCDPSGCPGLDGFSTGSYVALCNTLGKTSQRIAAVLFHEMVHSVGGTELDAEALENHFFFGNGATPPFGDDFPKFHSEGGEFVIWDTTTGSIFEKCEQGGSWDSSPTITRGTQLIPNFPDPPSGGGGGSWI